jgi:hypothetical protein
MAGFEPAASSVRGKSSSGLSYILLALRREIESLSPDRQSGRLTRCVTEHGNDDVELVRLGRLERPLNALSTHSLCRLGYRRELEDQAGFEPAVSLRCRLKRPARSTATVTGPKMFKASKWRTRMVTIHMPTG